MINLDHGNVSFLEQLRWGYTISPQDPDVHVAHSSASLMGKVRHCLYLFWWGEDCFFQYGKSLSQRWGVSPIYPYDSFSLEYNRVCSCLACLHCCHCIWGQKDETLTKYWTFRSCGICCTNCREQLWPKVYCLSLLFAFFFFFVFLFLPKPALLSSMWNTDRSAPWVHTFWDCWNGVWVLIAVFEWAAGQRSECYLLFMLSVS